MGGVNYHRLEQTARRLIRENGRPMTIERPAQGTYNGTTGETDYGDGDGQPQTFDTIGVMGSFITKLIDGALIKTTERSILLDARIRPEVDDVIREDGEIKGTVIAPIEEIKPGKVAVMYKVTVQT